MSPAAAARTSVERQQDAPTWGTHRVVSSAGTPGATCAAGGSSRVHRLRAHRPRGAAADGTRTLRLALSWAAATVSLSVSLAACSVFGVSAPTPSPTVTAPLGAPTAETMPPTTSPTSSGPSASPTSSGGQQAIATLQGGNGMARTLVLGDKAVPAGWQDSTPRETGGYRMTVCGVDLEPSAPLDGAQKRWQYSANGPFLEEHVRVYSGGTARAVVGALQRAIPRCTQYTTTDGQTSATYRVERLAVPGADAGVVTWRQRLTLPAPQPAATTATSPATAPVPTATATTAAPVLIQDVAVTRRGSSVVLLASYSVNTPPQPEVLATAVRALGPSS